MIRSPGLPFRSRRRATSTDAPAPPTEPPQLIAAFYQPGESVTLTFDRPVRADTAVPGAVTVDDAAVLGVAYTGNDVTAESDTTLRFGLLDTRAATGEDVTLDVTADNGIRPVDGGPTWGGIAGLALPFEQ